MAKEGPTGHPDFGWRRIASGGTGNGGRLVFVGLTPTGRRAVRSGKITRLVRAGATLAVAEVSVGIPHGNEECVALLAGELLALAGLGAGFPAGRRDWATKGWPATEISFPRREAAWAIAQAVVRG